MVMNMVDKNTEKKVKTESNSKRNTNPGSPAIFEDTRINTKIKLSILWIALMFFYAYNDILSFFQPGIVNELTTGEIEGIQMSQTFLIGAAILMSIPIIMIMLSLSLQAKTNRRTNIGIGIFHAVVLVGTVFAPGEIWIYYAYNMIAEGLIIALIVWTAWTWPLQEIHPRSGDQ